MNKVEADIHERMSRLDSFNEEELEQLEADYKAYYLPTWRKVLLIPYHLLLLKLLDKYQRNFKYISRVYLKPKSYSIFEIVKYGTLHALAFATIYVYGFAFVSGVWHPIIYTQELAKIKGKVIDNYLQNDPQFQEKFLYDAMRYFGVKEEVIGRTKQDMDGRRKELEEGKWFSEKFQEELKRKVGGSLLLREEEDEPKSEELKKEGDERSVGKDEGKDDLVIREAGGKEEKAVKKD